MARGALLLVLALAAVSPAPAAPAKPDVEQALAFLAGRQQPDGGFAEPGGLSDPTLTAWAVLAIVAGDSRVADQQAAAAYLRRAPSSSLTDLELRVVALAALDERTDDLVGELEAAIQPSGRIGPALNSTIWGVLALRSAGRPVPSATLAYLRRSQHGSGGFSWFRGQEPDSNDTAAAIQALRASGVARNARTIRRAFRYLNELRSQAGGFPLAAGGRPDAQSTGWVLQAYAATGTAGGDAPARFLARLQRPDGSFRYREGRVLTPVWVTAQVVPGLVGRPFPL